MNRTNPKVNWYFDKAEKWQEEVTGHVSYRSKKSYDKR